VFGGFSWRKTSGRKARPGDARISEAIPRLDPAGKNLPEKRSSSLTTGDLKSGRILQVLGRPASSGEPVNEGTAMGVPAVIACTRLISEQIAKLELELIRETASGPEVIKDHPAIRLMAVNPGDLHSPFELKKMMLTGKCLGGNGYARVFRDEAYRPRSVQWVPPCDIDPKLATRPNGEVFPVYDIAGQGKGLTRGDVIHIKGESRDGLTGLSPVTLMRESIGTALAQTSSAGSLMKNGTLFPGFLTTSANLNQEQISDAREEFNRNYAGIKNTGRVPVLNGTFDFKQTNGMSMVDAQFIESRRFELQEICRFYGVQPFLVGDSTASTTWGTGIEAMTLGFLNFCLDPHLTAFEEALNKSLLSTEEQAGGFYFRFDRDGLASVSRQDTAAYFTAMRNLGVYSNNDIRRKLDEPLIAPEDGGDDYRLPLNSSSKGTPEPAENNEPEREPAEA
jgi:HK97 family phage portal protein